MGCETRNDLTLSWPYMKYFVDFYSVVRICDAGENCKRKTNIVCSLWPHTLADRLCFVNYDLCSGAFNFIPFAIGCSV